MAGVRPAPYREVSWTAECFAVSSPSGAASGCADRPIALEDAVIEHLDVEGILGFAESVLCDASRLWEHAKPEHKRRLQRILFPQGVVFVPDQRRDSSGAGMIPTQAMCLAFGGLPILGEGESTMVALRGFEPRSDG